MEYQFNIGDLVTTTILGNKETTLYSTFPEQGYVWLGMVINYGSLRPSVSQLVKICPKLI